MTIAITGASGALGRAVTESIARQARTTDLVLLTRTPAKLAVTTAAQGAEVRHADFDQPDSLRDALRGVERLLLISTDAVGARLPQHHAAIDAAVDAGVRHVVYTSVPEPMPTNPALVVPDHAGTEERLRASGLQWTMLRNNLYSHLQISAAEAAIRTGSYVTNAGDGPTAYVTREDCAAAAAAVLTQPGHENTSYDVTGSQPLTAADLVDIIRAVSGEDVDLVQVSDDEMSSGLRRSGLPGDAADLVTSFGAASRAGYLSRVTSTVADLTGQEPAEMQQVLQTWWSHV